MGSHGGWRLGGGCRAPRREAFRTPGCIPSGGRRRGGITGGVCSSTGGALGRTLASGSPSHLPGCVVPDPWPCGCCTAPCVDRGTEGGGADISGILFPRVVRGLRKGQVVLLNFSMDALAPKNWFGKRNSGISGSVPERNFIRDISEDSGICYSGYSGLFRPGISTPPPPVPGLIKKGVFLRHMTIGAWFWAMACRVILTDPFFKLLLVLLTWLTQLVCPESRNPLTREPTAGEGQM